jgi:hypothetical protein
MAHGWNEIAVGAEPRSAEMSAIEWDAVARLGRCAVTWTLGAMLTTRRAWRRCFSWSPRRSLEVPGH